MKNHMRQGDLLFTLTNKEASGKEVKKLTIAEGEFTGHHHVLIAEAGSKITGTKTHFKVQGTAKLVHPEHDMITFGSGSYIVSVEREFDYINQELVKVRD